ncbi:MAG TPA: Os1348 family NHLP clan protein [Thermoanaerobaculia bacterium]|nr:Os1348 family NHLP clan protein [Thermoanaerobaculia bacterium]
MSQRSVEVVIGRLVTDEEFRGRFTQDPAGELRRLVESGVELNPCEFRVLCALDARVAARFAQEIDPRIQKADLSGGER